MTVDPKIPARRRTDRSHPGRRWLALGAAAALALLPAISDAEPMPTELAPGLAGLSADQRAFLESDAVYRLIPIREKLLLELAIREPAQIEEFASDMMTAIESMRFQPDEDLAAIPLNPNAEGLNFNSHRLLKPQILNERQRSAGPFSVSRYLYAKTGIPTFAGARVALTPEDLVAGQIDVAIAGIPIDISSGRRNSKHGPRALRAMHGLAEPDMLSLLDPLAELSVVDYGDFAIDYMSVHRSIPHVSEMVEQVAATGAVPMLVGGDHSMLYPAVTGVRKANPDRRLGVLHIGAHPDARRDEPHRFSDVQAVFRLLEEGVVAGPDLIQVGLRGKDVTPDTLRWLQAQGVRYHTMAEVTTRGWPKVAQAVLREASRGPEALFISFDLSALDPGQGAAIGRATPGGLELREVIPLIRRLCAERQVAGFEIMDLAPMLDGTYVSAMNANYLMNACLAGLALRKRGLSADWVDPLAISR